MKVIISDKIDGFLKNQGYSLGFPAYNVHQEIEWSKKYSASKGNHCVHVHITKKRLIVYMEAEDSYDYGHFEREMPGVCIEDLKKFIIFVEQELSMIDIDNLFIGEKSYEPNIIQEAGL
ncbi:hypothetical protein [Bacillus sp. NPDC094106]|uniref:hypothetical protein n=1 Tax=Bacillus sp. NPDC094106 TaxID=3363949 RepID=UPI0037FDDA16